MIRIIVRKHPVAFFYVVALVISWTPWLISRNALQGLMELDVPIWAIVFLLIGAAGPSFAALLTQRLAYGRGQARPILRDFLMWRVPFRWYAAIFSIPILIFLVSIPLIGYYTNIESEFDLRATLLIIPTLIAAFTIRFLIALPTGPLLEELGWRGFAMPNLQSRYSALTAGIVVGLMWGFWHLPLFWVPGAALPGGLTATEDPSQVFWYFSSVTGKSILFAWIYNNTKGSLFVDVLFHATINTTSNVFLPIFYPDLQPTVISTLTHAETGLTWIAVVVVVAYFGPKRLSRQNFDWLDEHTGARKT